MTSAAIKVRKSQFQVSLDIADVIYAEAEAQGNTWAPLQAGLFQKSIDRFRQVREAYQPFLVDVVKHMW